MRNRVPTMLVVSVLALFGSCVSSAMAAFPGTNGRIVFGSDRDGDAEIYSMDPDGTDQRNLTNDPARDGLPQVSADGQRVVFQSNRDDSTNPNATNEIWVMDADGLNQTRLTTDPGYDLTPAFSPDGQKIAWASSRAGGDLEIWVMDANGSNPTRLTTHAGDDYSPVFSPDGQKIAFNSERGGQGQLDVVVMDADGTDEVNLTNSAAVSDSQPAFSPDGQRIAFESTRDNATGGGLYEIYSMDADDGNNQTRLTTSASNDSEAAFSPDGQKILFSSNRTGNYEVFAMDVNGANPTNLSTTIAATDSSADWAPCAQPGGCATSTLSSVSLSDTRYAVSESGGQVNVAVRRSGGLNQTATVAFATSNGSATAGSDYEATSGSVSFAVGQTEAAFSVPVTNDSADEGLETFGVALSSPGAGAQLTSPASATVTIIDDDSASPIATPDTSITSGPSGPTWVEQPQFGFASSTAGATYRCRTDGQVYVPCTSLYDSPRLTAGDHTFSVYAVGPNGVADPTPATRTFRVNSAQTRRADCQVSPFKAVDNGRGTGDLDTTCEIYLGERPSCQAFKVCEYRPNDACPPAAICTLQTTASWNQVERRYLAVAYANSRLEQTSPPLTVSGRFSQSCRTVTDCSVADTQQAMGRAPMVSTCSALVTVPDGPGYVDPPKSYKPSASAAAASLKLGCRATWKIRPAPAYTLYPTAAKFTTFLPAAGRVTVTPVSGKSSAAGKKKKKKKKKSGSAQPFRPIAATATRAGAIVLSPKLSGDAKASLKRKRRLRASVRIVFTPRNGGARVTKTQTVTLTPQAKRPARCVRRKRGAKRPKTCVPKQLR